MYVYINICIYRYVLQLVAPRQLCSNAARFGHVLYKRRMFALKTRRLNKSQEKTRPLNNVLQKRCFTAQNAVANAHT